MGLLELFQRERARFWTQLEALGADHGEIASLLSRDGDPRTSYLVETAAYAAARLFDVLSDDAPEETSAIIGSAMPSLLRPTPSMTVIRWRPSAGMGDLPAGRVLHSSGPRPAEFQTRWPIVTGALVVERCACEMQGAKRQVLRLRLRAMDGSPLAIPESLRLFLTAPDPLHALDVVRAMVTSNEPLRASILDKDGRTLRVRDGIAARLHLPALAEPFTLFPGRRDAFPSGPLLRALHTFPEVFSFVDVEGLRGLVPHADKNERILELEIPLSEPLPDHAYTVTCELHCTPAINVRRVSIPKTLFTASRQPLPLPDDAELYEVESVVMEGRGPLRLLENDEGAVMRRGDVIAQIHRRPALGHAPSECDLELLPIESEFAPCSIAAELLVIDGMRTERLYPGDITWGASRAGAVNVTRVTPPYPVAQGRELGWRGNALARITSAKFATAPSLRRLLDLHDVAVRSSSDGRGIDTVTRTPGRKILRDSVHGGDAVDVVMNPRALGGKGKTWLVGELLARALSERTDALRYSRLRWVAKPGDPTVHADYGLRAGERLPFPF